MLRFFCLYLLLCRCLFAQLEPEPLAQTVLRQVQGKEARWDYALGLFARSVRSLGVQSHDDALVARAEDLFLQQVGADGAIRGYKPEDDNLDHVAPGRILLEAYAAHPEERVKKALDQLREQLRHQPRTADGGFWHKKKYVSQMWLDGLYMASPFLAHYGEIFHDEGSKREAVKQILLMDQHAYDPAKGLYYHAWDEKKAQEWANPQTGCSPNFWSRSLGWFAMAVVDVMEVLPADSPEFAQVRPVLERIAKGVARYQDPASGLWWQVTDQAARSGNYLESSASCMFVYSLAKAVRLGWLPEHEYGPVIRKGAEGIQREFIRKDDSGETHLTHCCEVAGLGFTNAAGRKRDGSFEYYISEPVIEDDLKAVGPYLLAAVELRKMKSADDSPGLDEWKDVPGWIEWMKQREPKPCGNEIDVRSRGAKPDGDLAKVITSIQQESAGKGVDIRIPAGEWKSGPWRLQSHTHVILDAGAIVRFSTEAKDYPVVFTRWEGLECMNYSSLIYAYGAEDISITGAGTLDGQADDTTWWAWNSKKVKPNLQQPARKRLAEMGDRDVPVAQRVFGDGSFLRPNFIQFHSCKNVLIQGVSIIRSPMWEIHPVLSQNVTVRGVKVTSHGPNNDGCDPECCRNVLIEDCLFDTGDDCIAIKSGRNRDGRRVNVPSEKIVIRNCEMKDGHGGVVLGSEISGGVNRVFVEDCVMDSPNLDRALRLKSNAVRGGVLEKIRMRRVKIGQVREAVLTIDLLYEEGAKGDFPPVIRDVKMEDIVSESSPRISYVRTFPAATIENVSIRRSTFRGLKYDEPADSPVKLEQVTREKAGR
jgi:unsaturated rhamnogalacturonyl hydrolase